MFTVQQQSWAESLFERGRRTQAKYFNVGWWLTTAPCCEWDIGYVRLERACWLAHSPPRSSLLS